MLCTEVYFEKQWVSALQLLFLVLFSSYFSLINMLRMSLSQCLYFSFLTKPTVHSTRFSLLPEDLLFALSQSHRSYCKIELSSFFSNYSVVTKRKKLINYCEVQPSPSESTRRDNCQRNSVAVLHHVVPFCHSGTAVDSDCSKSRRCKPLAS